jgi:predicted RNase H-like nuclease (RuvC/YqgF family)
MRRNVTLLCLLGAALLLTGCININADARGFGGRPEARETPPPDPAGDPRSIADINRENAQLRQNLAKLERDHQAWQSAVDRQKNEKDALENQRDDLEKQRDRAKDARDDRD